jgi:hypothetical protein
VLFVRVIRGLAWNTTLFASEFVTVMVCSLRTSPNEEVARAVYVPSGTPVIVKIPFASVVAVNAVPTRVTVVPLTPF